MNSSARLFVVGLSAVGLLLAAVTGGTAQRTKSVSLATGGVAGVYYPLGGAMAQAWSKNVQGLTVTAESTGASVVNVRLIEGGEAELAMVQNDIASYAYNAQEMFAKDKPRRKIAGMTMLYPEVIQIVTLQDRGIKTVSDLKGKRVAVGAPGSGTEANARQILQAHEITYADITEHFLPFGEAVEALRDGRIDAAFLTAGIPTAAVIDLGATQPVSLVSIAADKAKEIASRWNFYSDFTIPGGTYTGIKEATPTVTVQAMLIVSTDLEAERVNQMLEVLFRDDTLKALCNTHVRGCDVSRKTAQVAMPLPLHPGAEKFFGKK
jgi:uncharacterized protein